MTLRNLLTCILIFFSTFLFGQTTILWKVTSTNNKNISYLLGTYHLFGNSFIDSFPVIAEKIQASDLIITELKLDREKIAALYNARPESGTLHTVLSKEDEDFIQTIFKKPVGQTTLLKFTPGELYVKLQAYYPKYKCSVINKNDTQSMDEYVQNLGNRLQKKLYYFETDSFQFEALSEATKMIDWKIFKKNVPSLLDKYRNTATDESLCLFANQYASFAVDYKFKDPCNLLNNNAMNNALVIKRNEDWLKKLPSLLENNNCFIAVGLGHFFNKCGLIEQLKELGYIVEPVNMK
jgi:uncharacterized protein